MDLALCLVLGLLIVLCIGLLIDAVVRWMLARSLWSQVIEREDLASSSAWSRVKVWTGKPNFLVRPVYAMMYADDVSIRIESRKPINKQLITTLDRASCASHWRDDFVEFKAAPSAIRIKAIGAGLPVSSIQQTNAFWHLVQPTCADPFDNGVRRVESWADRRSKLVLMALGVIALVALLELLLLDHFWLLSNGLLHKLWWVPVFAAMPIAIGMKRDYVPTMETGAASLMLAVGLAIGGYIGLKRADQWISSPQPQRYVLRVNGDRELFPVSATGPTINLRLASAAWNDVALGSEHTVLVHGGALGTAQINYDQLLPSTQPKLTN